MSNCTKNSLEACKAPFCEKNHTELNLTVWNDQNGESVETFCIDHWTPEQISAFREFLVYQNRLTDSVRQPVKNCLTEVRA